MSELHASVINILPFMLDVLWTMRGADKVWGQLYLAGESVTGPETTCVNTMSGITKYWEVNLLL